MLSVCPSFSSSFELVWSYILLPSQSKNALWLSVFVKCSIVPQYKALPPLILNIHLPPHLPLPTTILLYFILLLMMCLGISVGKAATPETQGQWISFHFHFFLTTWQSVLEQNTEHFAHCASRMDKKISGYRKFHFPNKLFYCCFCLVYKDSQALSLQKWSL